MQADADVLELPRGMLRAARMSAEELRVEIAVHLYSQRRLSMGNACQLAGMSLWQFQHVLAARGIGPRPRGR
jgi:predicted HTH domain antitoxin